MKTWKIVLMALLPTLRMAGHFFRAQDEDNFGKDDLTGISLEYMADLGESLVNGKPPPRAPDVLAFAEAGH